MGNSSGGWAAAFAATTSDIWEFDGETDVQTSSAVQVAVPFFPPTDFLSMDEFAELSRRVFRAMARLPVHYQWLQDWQYV